MPALLLQYLQFFCNMCSSPPIYAVLLQISTVLLQYMQFFCNVGSSSAMSAVLLQYMQFF
jgi:hypothetical protein